MAASRGVGLGHGLTPVVMARLAALEVLHAPAGVSLGPWDLARVNPLAAPWSPGDPAPLTLVTPAQRPHLSEALWRRAPPPLTVFCAGIRPPSWWSPEWPALAGEEAGWCIAARLQRLAPRLARWVDHHATLVSVAGKGILLTGEVGRGKSELALALVERGHRLVADDRVCLAALSPRHLLGRAPRLGRGRLHVRDVGVMELAAWRGRRVWAAVQLVHAIVSLDPPSRAEERLVPVPERETLAGVPLPRYHVAGQGRNLSLLVEYLAEHVLDDTDDSGGEGGS